MPAPKNNNYWQFRKKHGRDHEYTPEGLWEELIAYSKWIKENPLEEEKVFSFQGKAFTHTVNKMRAMTIKAFCLFADICETTFSNYRKNEDFVSVITRIENIIYSQKFEGAAAELLNPNIIARDLGLKDKAEIHNINETVEYEVSEKAKDDLDKITNEND